METLETGSQEVRRKSSKRSIPNPGNPQRKRKRSVHGEQPLHVPLLKELNLTKNVQPVMDVSADEVSEGFSWKRFLRKFNVLSSPKPSELLAVQTSIVDLGLQRTLSGMHLNSC
jgi:hypothetical protein